MRRPIPICSCGKCFRIGDLDAYQDLAPHALRRGWVRDGDDWTCAACRRKKGNASMGTMRIDHEPEDGNPWYRVRVSKDRRNIIANGHEELLMAVRHYFCMPGHSPGKCPTCSVIRQFTHTGARVVPGKPAPKPRARKKDTLP